MLNPFHKALTACAIAAFICATATAQDLTRDEDEVEFAGAEVCRPGLIDVPLELKSALHGESGDLPTELEADRIDAEADQTVILHGNAKIVQGKRGVYAERMVYHRDQRRATAQGNVVLYSVHGDEIKADALEMDVDTFVGEGVGIAAKIADRESSAHDHNARPSPETYSIFASPPDAAATAAAAKPDADNTPIRARAFAQSIQFEGGDVQRLKDVSMTTCAPGNQDVLLKAKEIHLDHASGVGTAKSMTVKFKNVPVFYFPTVTFPLNDDRKTGFLFPALGYTEKSGWIIETPYYINLAPQYDATLTPRLLSQRGAQIFGQFRYLSANGNGRVRGEFLPSDNAYDDEDRHALGYQHRHQFNRQWSASADLQTVSDSDYLRDFSSDIDFVSSSYVARKARLDYAGDGVRFSARAAAYDSVNDDVAKAERPYSTLPSLSLALRPRKLELARDGGLQLALGLDAEYANFQHDACAQAKPCGTRLRVKPFISAPFNKHYGYIEPKMSLQSIRYSLDEHDPARGASPSEEVPIFSVDSGLFFERELDNSYLQTLEPRLFYVKIPQRRKQRDFPDFDTDDGSDSSFEHFFRENRFFGGDRVGDTEHLAVGVSSRVIARDTGEQRLKLSLGQIFYFQDRELGLRPDAAPATEDSSGVIGQVTATPNSHWHFTTFARWGDREKSLNAFRLAAGYRDNPRRHATLVYVFKDDSAAAELDTQQINAALASSLTPHWQAHASAAYSLEDDEVRSAEVGLSFDGCCWAVRVVAQRYLDGGVAGEHKNRLVITFEMDDLGRINSRL